MKFVCAGLGMLLLVGCRQTPQPKPEPAKTVTPERALEMERQREAKIPCSTEWQKTATPEQKKKCLEQDPIHQGLKSMQTAKQKEKQ